MDYSEIISRLSKTLNAYDNCVIEEITDELFFDVAKQAELQLRLELREPMSEKDITALSSERGFNLPTDFLDWYSEAYPLRISPSGADSEGTPIAIVPDVSLYE